MRSTGWMLGVALGGCVPPVDGGAWAEVPLVEAELTFGYDSLFRAVFEYDVDGRLASVRVRGNSPQETVRTYHWDGDRIVEDEVDGIVKTHGWDRGRRVSAAVTGGADPDADTCPDAAPRVVSGTWTWTYDEAGRRVAAEGEQRIDGGCDDDEDGLETTVSRSWTYRDGWLSALDEASTRSGRWMRRDPLNSLSREVTRREEAIRFEHEDGRVRGLLAEGTRPHWNPDAGQVEFEVHGTVRGNLAGRLRLLELLDVRGAPYREAEASYDEGRLVSLSLGRREGRRLFGPTLRLTYDEDAPGAVPVSVDIPHDQHDQYAVRLGHRLDLAGHLHLTGDEPYTIGLDGEIR